ncbi:MAG: 4Fe-4S dicluster domain-containing protein [Pseudomonadales bacterium]|nr:4Fe-4S dicluster domain-containing protein [Pseudomonadales bacterium]MDP6828998.1 4Fe-4S dicluster domain-containing protein [Pseudomonadales bacterium]
MKQTPIVDDANDARYGVVEIDLDKCNGCRICTLICPSNVLELFGEKHNRRARIKEGLVMCLACDNCHAICDRDAISIVSGYDFAGRYKQLGRGAPSQPRLEWGKPAAGGYTGTVPQCPAAPEMDGRHD